jgi:hypothetical protein
MILKDVLQIFNHPWLIVNAQNLFGHTSVRPDFFSPESLPWTGCALASGS